MGAGRTKIKVDLNIAPLMLPVAHGRNPKDMVVFHETVSPDYKGFQDILGVARYMPSRGLGIHGIIDAEGYLGWAVLMEPSVLYHTASNNGGVNTRSIGIEMISRVMLDYPDNQRRFQWWWQRKRQLEKAAQVLAYLHRTQGIPLDYTVGNLPGVTTHWQITQTYKVAGGHVDAWPRHAGGYFPVNRIIYRARQLAKRGY